MRFCIKSAIRGFFQAATFSVLLTGICMHTASAQNYRQTARAFIQSPQALAMGDAGVAFGSPESAFFYNPAVLGQMRPGHASVYLTLPRPTITASLFDKVQFVVDEIAPAIEAGIDGMPAAEMSDLYDRTFRVASERTTVNVDMVMPSVFFKVGDLGLALGVFGQSLAQIAVGDAGAGVPMIDVSGRGDVMGAASAGMDLSRYGVEGLSAGLTAKFTMRHVSLKQKPLDAFSGDERISLLKANSMGFDLGLQYTIQQVPGLQAGLAVYDLIASDFKYSLSRTLAGNKSDHRSLSEEIALASELSLAPSYRIGGAYTFQTSASTAWLRGSGLAMDYVGYGNAPIDQPVLAHLHMGGQLQLIDRLAFRAGIGQGYTSVGAGVRLGFLRVDYAYYGQEAGRLPGQLPAWYHTVQTALSF
jgi:hypothetical protein